MTYTRRELKRALRTKTVSHDMPKWVFDEVERYRKKRNRELPTTKALMEEFMLKEMKLKKVRPFISARSLKGRLLIALRKSRSPAWLIRAREYLKDIFY